MIKRAMDILIFYLKALVRFHLKNYNLDDIVMSDAIENKGPLQVFNTNRDKLIELLLNEITFLDQCFYKSESIEERGCIMVALETFENLLKIQGHMNQELSDRDYEDMREFIYQTIKNAVIGIP